MEKADVGIDLRVSAEWSILLLAVAALWLMFPSNKLIGTSHYIRAQMLGIGIICLSVLLWGVLLKWPTLGRWLLVMTTSVSVIVARQYLELPGTLTLLVLPTAMAVAFISVRAGIIIVAMQTLLLLSIAWTGFFMAGEIGVSLFASLATLGILSCVYYRVYQLADWASAQYKEAQANVKEARDRRAELEQTLQSLQHANRQLALDNQRMSGLSTIADEARRSKAAFVSRVSHEFRAPLNMIIGLVGLMVDRPEVYGEDLPPDLLTDLEIIHRNSTHLAEMVNDVLDLSQTEVGRLTLHREHFNLADVIHEAMEAVSPLVWKKGLSLAHHVPSCPVTVYGDRTRIRQVLLNLLSNAARFTESGAISVDVNVTEGEVIVGISDTGPGIPSEAMEHLFEPFYRVPATSQQIVGSGLGLSISREIVQHHGGRIWVESEPGQGARFLFSLPTQEPLTPTRRPGHQIVENWVWHEVAFRTERVARESKFLRPFFIVLDPEETLKRVLESHRNEIEFLVRHTLEDALSSVTAYSAHAILANTNTYGAKSSALLDQLRAAAPNTLVVACDVPHPMTRAWAAGADGYLIKPISRESLDIALDSVAHSVGSLLIVDDESESVQLIARIVETIDPSIAVTSASDADSALTAMRVQRPDLVLLDVVMSGDNGWSVLASMHDDPQLAEIPVYFVSGMDPSNVPPTSEYLTATVNGGMSIEKILEASLTLSSVLLAREMQPG